MDLQNRRHLHAVARDRLEKAQEAPKIALVYGGVVVLATLLSTSLNYILGTQISQSGGLHNLGFRSALSSIQTMVPMILNFLLMALELGFTGAMLRVSRSQYAGPKSMKIGFDRFWVLLRATLIQGILYFAVGMVSFYLSLQLFMLTPLSNKMMDIVIPLMQQSATLTPDALVADPAMANALTMSMLPMFLLMLVIMCAVALPIYYHLRMVNYILIDKPGTGAFAAIRESRMMMRKNCMSMFKLDLSMWWYFVATIIASAVCYGDVLLAMLGVSLPISGTVSYFLFLILYLLASLAITLLLRPHVEVAYSLAYDSLRPREQENGVVLGNIFNM